MTLDLLAVVKQAVREVLREEGFATAKPSDTGTRITLQEAADLVWEDWRQRMKGDHVIPIEDWRTHYVGAPVTTGRES